MYVRQKFIEQGIALVPATGFALQGAADDASGKDGGKGEKA